MSNCLRLSEGKVLGKNSASIDLAGKIYENLFQEVVTDYYSKHIIPDNITFSGIYEDEGELIASWLSLKKQKNSFLQKRSQDSLN